MELSDLLNPSRPPEQQRISYWVTDSLTSVDTELMISSNQTLRATIAETTECGEQLRTALQYLMSVYGELGAEQVWDNIQQMQWQLQQSATAAFDLLGKLSLLLQWRERAAQIYASAEDSAKGFAAACSSATVSTCAGEGWIRKASRSILVQSAPLFGGLFAQADFGLSLGRYIPTMIGKKPTSGSDSLEAQMQIQAASAAAMRVATFGIADLLPIGDKTRLLATGLSAILSTVGTIAAKPDGKVILRTEQDGETRYIYTDDTGKKWSIGPPTPSSTKIGSITSVGTIGAWFGLQEKDRKEGRPPPRPIQTVSTPSGTDQILEQMKGPTSAGEVEILKHQTGQETSWSVLIRGTKEWMPASENPHDMLSNLQEVAGQKSDLSRSVVAAMEAAGVAPGQAVELVGHSQGGIVAANLASDPQILQKYNISSVLTAGSPIGGAIPDPRVQILSLENLADIVPALDGRGNQMSAGGVTVYFDEGLGEPGQPRTQPRPGVSPHQLDSYVTVAGALEKGTAGGLSSGTVVNWMANRRNSLGFTDETVTTSQHFETVRIQ